MLNRVWLFATSWMVTHQALLSTEFSKQDYWSGLPFPTPGDLPDPGIEPDSPTSPALTDRIFITVRPWGILIYAIQYYLIHLSLINTCKILMYVTVPLQSFHDIFSTSMILTVFQPHINAKYFDPQIFSTCHPTWSPLFLLMKFKIHNQGRNYIQFQFLATHYGWMVAFKMIILRTCGCYLI